MSRVFRASPSTSKRVGSSLVSTCDEHGRGPDFDQRRGMGFVGFDSIPTKNPRSSADRRSGHEAHIYPRPATVPLPCPRMGDSGPSRWVPDGGASRGGREEGCRGADLGLPGGFVRWSPPGPPTPARARGAAARDGGCETDEEPTRHQRNRRCAISYGWLGESNSSSTSERHFRNSASRSAPACVSPIGSLLVISPRWDRPYSAMPSIPSSEVTFSNRQSRPSCSKGIAGRGISSCSCEPDQGVKPRFLASIFCEGRADRSFPSRPLTNNPVRKSSSKRRNRDAVASTHLTH